MNTTKQSLEEGVAQFAKSAEGLHGNTTIAQTVKKLKASIAADTLEAKVAKHADLEAISSHSTQGLGDSIKDLEGESDECPGCLNKVFAIEQGLVPEQLDERAGQHVDVEDFPDENHTDLSVEPSDPIYG